MQIRAGNSPFLWNDLQREGRVFLVGCKAPQSLCPYFSPASSLSDISQTPFPQRPSQTEIISNFWKMAMLSYQILKCCVHHGGASTWRSLPPLIFSFTYLLPALKLSLDDTSTGESGSETLSLAVWKTISFPCSVAKMLEGPPAVLSSPRITASLILPGSLGIWWAMHWSSG